MGLLPFIVFLIEVFIELINWKLEQLESLAEKEQKEMDSEIKFEERQKAFDLMFKLNESSTDFDRIQSASSRPTTSRSVAPFDDKIAQKYSNEAKRKKVATTKFWLQDIPGTTIALLVLYMFVVIIQC